MGWTGDSSTIPYIFDPDSLHFQWGLDESSYLPLGTTVHKHLEDEAHAHTVETIERHDRADDISSTYRSSPPGLDRGCSFLDVNTFSNEFINDIWVDPYQPSLEQYNDFSSTHTYTAASSNSGPEFHNSFIHDDDRDVVALGDRHFIVHPSFEGIPGESSSNDHIYAGDNLNYHVVLRNDAPVPTDDPPAPNVALSRNDAPSHTDAPSQNGSSGIADKSLPTSTAVNNPNGFDDSFECKWQDCSMKLVIPDKQSRRAILLHHLKNEHHVSRGPLQRRTKVRCRWDWCDSEKRYNIGIKGIVQHITRFHGKN